MLYHFLSEVSDFREFLVPKFPGNRAKNACPTGIVFFVNDDQGVSVEADISSIITTGGFPGSNNNGSDDITGLNFTTRIGFLHAGDNDITHAGIATLVATQHLDTHTFLAAAVIGHIKISVHLDH